MKEQIKEERQTTEERVRKEKNNISIKLC